MLSINNITYRIGNRTILENCNLAVMDGWRVGVIGVNGAGKSTLFKLITGELHADGGSVSVPQNKRFAQVRQDMPETEDALVDVVLASNVEMAELWRRTETETDPNKIADIYERLADMDAYAAPAKAATLLIGLGFKEHQLTEPFSSFSGGWRMRVALASVLFLEPEILLLDEPTNHLDLEAIMWLENYLINYPHTMMVISHDRDLLNKCVDHVAHIDKKQLTLYTGNYDTFERERAFRLGLQQKMHEKQMAAKEHMQAFVDRFKAQASKARQAQSRMKAIEKMDIVDAVIADRAVRFNFPNPEKIGSPMISMDNADVAYGDGPTILHRVHTSIDIDDRIALLGANGNGKSTMMKLIAGELTVKKGSLFRSGKLRIGYFSQHQTDQLDLNSTPYLEMFDIMRKKNPNVVEPVVRAKLGAFGFSRELADNKIKSLSGGEKARLLFAFMSFDAPHLLLLDEPTNHLDIEAREALVNALNEYTGAVVIVSHDPTMVERVADRLLLVKDGGCSAFDGDLNDYRKFTIQVRREERSADKDKKAKEAEKQPEPASVAENVTKIDAKKVKQAEKEIARLTKEKETLEAEMAKPGFYNSGKKIAETQQAYDKVVQELQTYETVWLEAQVGSGAG